MKKKHFQCWNILCKRYNFDEQHILLLDNVSNISIKISSSLPFWVFFRMYILFKDARNTLLCFKQNLDIFYYNVCFWMCVCVCLNRTCYLLLQCVLLCVCACVKIYFMWEIYTLHKMFYYLVLYFIKKTNIQLSCTIKMNK